MMMSLVVKGTISNDNIGRDITRLRLLVLLRSKHNQRQVVMRPSLPKFILFSNLLCMGKEVTVAVVCL